MLDERFHIALVAAAGNPETDLVYRQVTEHIRIMRRLDFAYGDCIRDTYEEHIAILDALDAGDVAQTEALLLQHIQDSHTVVEQITIDRLEQVRTELGQQPAAAPGRRKHLRYSLRHCQLWLALYFTRDRLDSWRPASCLDA